MLVLKIFPRLSKSAAFSRPKLWGTPTSPPRKPPLPHDDGSATDRASAWRARKSSADCTQRAVSPPGRTAACACDCIGLGLFFFFLQPPSPTVAASTGSPGCAGYTALAPTPTPSGGVPAPSDCGLANRRRLHTVCSEPARANCSMCHLVWRVGVGAFSKKGLVLTATGTHSGHCTRGWGLAHRCRLHARG